MERSEKIGLGVAVLGHVVLFGALSLSWLWPPEETPKAKPIEISLVDDVALESQAPPSTEPPAQSRAPEEAPPEDAAPPEPAVEEPAPTPPAKQPEPAPAPKPAPKAPPPPKKPPVTKPDKAKTPPAKTATTAPKAASVAKATGDKPGAKRRNPGGFALSAETLKGLSAAPSKSKTATPPGATMNTQAAADIGSAIVRQVQPCANRQVKPGPGAERIRVQIRLQLNKDGSLAARPTIVGHTGVDDENGRYVDAVDRNAIATFMGCSPLRGLPIELYDVPRGWKTFSLRYNLPG
ncbi:cell envelope biogenesis protein TolA [Sphingomonas sp. So64.6b]|uniref:cell envelope biogenesis protein TolA n=1 Tax=Sphingomonas sp. So64.6b TaxID=2997354 RepID=UPI00160378E9|nr:cell envelope biogenesis protein TolA [Sphingomonas sp. So64.6b]QNA86010.1 cell envelope biogenesis protein TolA [Sphingomonas sp. So64.6b]